MQALGHLRGNGQVPAYCTKQKLEQYQAAVSKYYLSLTRL